MPGVQGVSKKLRATAGFDNQFHLLEINYIFNPTIPVSLRKTLISGWGKVSFLPCLSAKTTLYYPEEFEAIAHYDYDEAYSFTRRISDRTGFFIEYLVVGQPQSAGQPLHPSQCAGRS